jgi:hypothetical protein
MVRRLVGALMMAFILLSSGCALFLLGAGGTAGYLIRKGEDEGSSGSAKKGTPEPHSKSSSKTTGETKGSASSD